MRGFEIPTVRGNGEISLLSCNVDKRASRQFGENERVTTELLDWMIGEFETWIKEMHLQNKKSINNSKINY